MSYAYAGDYSHSLEDFNSIIRIHPNDPTGYTMRGFLLAMLHNYDAPEEVEKTRSITFLDASRDENCMMMCLSIW